MRAAASDPATAKRLGIKQSVAEDFVEATHGQSVRDLPERVQRKAAGGAVDQVYPRKFRW